jgi:hypothetical protein
MRPSTRSLANIEGRVVRLGVNVSVKLFHLVAMPERKCSVLFIWFYVEIASALVLPIDSLDQLVEIPICFGEE